MIGRWAQSNLSSTEIGTGSIMLANRYFTSTNNITIMVAVAMSVFIAQFLGAKKNEKIRKTFGIGIMLVSILYFIFAVIGLIFAPKIIEFFATTRQDGALMIEHGTTYLRIILLSFIPLSLSTPIAFALRGTKHTLVPMLATLGTALSNIIFNILFIYVFDFGIAGAAIATLISRFIELTILLIYFFKKKPEFYGKVNELFSFTKLQVKQLLHYSIPTSFAQVITEAIVIFMLFSYARIDAGNSNYISAITLTQSVVDLVVAFVGGMGTAASILVGTRLGAGKVEEAKENARWQLTYVAVVGIISVIVMILLIPIINYIYGFNAETQRILKVIMVIHAFSLPFSFFSTNVVFITRSGGFSKSAIIINNLTDLLIKIPLVIIFVFITPEAFVNSNFFAFIFPNLSGPDGLIIFVFLLDRLIEVIRFVVASIVYHKVPWAKSLNDEISTEDNDQLVYNV